MRPRWWQKGELTIEGQAEGFRKAGLEFNLDQQVLDATGVVVFRGALRRGRRRIDAHVFYPPAFDHGEHPIVIAPGLDVGRHCTPNGLLCLDHAVDGEITDPMSGAEAVELAERLWMLWETDRAQLANEEAEAPDPWAGHVAYAPDTALLMIDVDVAGYEFGYLHLGLGSVAPIRGSVVGIRPTHPKSAELPASDANNALRGGLEAKVPWIRLSEHPPEADPVGIDHWLAENHPALIKRAHHAFEGGPVKQSQIEALLGLVYPDEGPNRGETHDAWLFVAIQSNGSSLLPRPIQISSEERWLRQPQLKPLAKSRVAIVGVGALGSQVADLLARAGVGNFTLVDYDLFMPENLVRHELDLSNIGQSKAEAIGRRIVQVNPWAAVVGSKMEVGGVGSGTLPHMQKIDDELAARLGDCDLIVNATANATASVHLSEIAADVNTPVVHGYVSPGAWGARILVQRPGDSACWHCLGLWQEDARASVPGGGDGSDTIPTEGIAPEVAAEPGRSLVVDRGCADPTFTGPGFELTASAAAIARAATGIALDGDGYPAPDFDLATLRFRGENDARTSTDYTRLPVHDRCTTCRR